MNIKEEIRKTVQYVFIWWLIVFTCGLLGEKFPALFRNEPQYDVWEEHNWIIHISTNTVYYYEIQEDKEGNLLYYIEAGEEHCGYYFIESKIMVVDSANLNYYELFRELFDELINYYQWKDQQMVEIPDNL